MIWIVWDADSPAASLTINEQFPPICCCAGVGGQGYAALWTFPPMLPSRMATFVWRPPAAPVVNVSGGCIGDGEVMDCRYGDVQPTGMDGSE